MNECIWKCVCGWKGTSSEMVEFARCPKCHERNSFSFVEYNPGHRAQTGTDPATKVAAKS